VATRQYRSTDEGKALAARLRDTARGLVPTRIDNPLVDDAFRHNLGEPMAVALGLPTPKFPRLARRAGRWLRSTARGQRWLTHVARDFDVAVFRALVKRVARGKPSLGEDDGALVEEVSERIAEDRAARRRRLIVRATRGERGPGD
jgi:hypothetical protein